MSEPYPFVWFPVGGQRHAIHRNDRNVPQGAPMHCFCGAIHPRGPDGELEKHYGPPARNAGTKPASSLA
jgi:hypothetical protein